MSCLYEKAIKLSNEADKRIIKNLSNRENFVVEAGAGSGKTYSLIKVVDWLLKEKQKLYIEHNKKIACITFTNAAVEVIKERLPENCFIVPSTIHSFLWSSIKIYQSFLVKFTKELFSAYILEKNVSYEFVNYTLGVRDIRDKVFYLYHDDVLKLFCKFMEYEKFRKIFTSNYPIILIDEYQDLNVKIYECFVKYFLVKNEGPQLIFFGDSWQSIYNTGYSQELVDLIPSISKPSNFRSTSQIVDVLNKIRPKNSQFAAYDYGGKVLVITNNDFPNELRLKKSPNKGDLPIEEFQKREKYLKKFLISKEQWALNNTKELMLTHNLISKSISFENLFELLKREGVYEKKDKVFAFCSDIIEPIYDSLMYKKYSQLFEILKNYPIISSKNKKNDWTKLFNALTKARKGNIFDVLSVVHKSGIIPIPEEIIIYFNMLDKDIVNLDKKINDLMSIEYSEVINASKYVNNETIYRTDHGVKGEEFENVLLIIGRGWNNYKFDKYLQNPLTKDDANYKSYVRNRNLFYVACSRPIKNLVLFITYEIDSDFNKYLENVFQRKNIIPYSSLKLE